MKLKFQADGDLDGRIIRGVKRAAPDVDIRTAVKGGIVGRPDLAVLRLAAAEGRVLVSQDRRTMPAHFAAFLKDSVSPGVILLRSRISIRVAIDEIVLIWSTTELEKFVNRLVWIPL